MAYNDSGELPIASDPTEENIYNLGGYSFELKVQNVHEPGEPDAVSVFAICRSPDGSRQTQAMDFPPGTTVTGWYVEANETEASVYANIHTNAVQIDTGNVEQPIPTSSSLEINYGKSGSGIKPWYTDTYSGDAVFFGTCTITGDNGTSRRNMYAASPNPGTRITQSTFNHAAELQSVYEHPLDSTYTYNGKTVYYWGANFVGATQIYSASGFSNPYIALDKTPQVMWALVYSSEEKDEEVLVARFAIDLREADGGPDGDWDEPGDVGPDPEKHFTLTVSVTGASAGSNNGTPLEAGQAGGYGDGGTGGNGGGGGAGASTVIIWDFATNKADNVVQEATARGPGTGGPGGKGGKGGDGCILIFY